jgi:ABC-type polysaccharide/polyol phosphate transport system ATPase subunit
VVLEIVNLSKKYAWHRAATDASDDDPDLSDEDEPQVEEPEPAGERWALRGINLTINAGEKIGIIGPNGAGKSTLINILAGITLPSEGYVRGRGLRVLLNSLRRPFRGHLSGRENLYILTALLGVDASRLDVRLPDILAFSDMEDLIDRRVAQYSSQQYQRLAFMTALMLDAEVILSDDLFSVGDSRYQQKCERYIAEKAKQDGVIFVFASNRLDVIQDLCTRVIWLEDGRVTADGPAEQVIEAFMNADRVSGEADEAESRSMTPAAEPQPSPSVAESPVPPAVEPPPMPADGDPPNARMDEKWLVRWTKDSQFLQEEVDRRQREADADGPPETVAIEPEGLADDARVPVPEWDRLAAKAMRRRKRTEQKWMARLAEVRQPMLLVDRKRPSIPGLGTLEDLCFKPCGNEAPAGRSRLELVLSVEKPSTEVSVLVEGVHGQTHVFTAELPVPLIAPRSGIYFLTLEIDDALLRPCAFAQGHTKGRLSVRAYIRASENEDWQVLRGDIRFILQGEDWRPLPPYPPGRPGPILKPMLEWRVQMSAADSPDSAAAE